MSSALDESKFIQDLASEIFMRVSPKDLASDEHIVGREYRLPESIEKLTGLKYLEMTSCMKLQDLPSSLLKLSNLVTLKIGGCYRLRGSFIRFEEVGQKLETLKTLHFNNVNLSDRDLHAIIHSFPNLKDLNVSRNKFVSIPTFIKESTNLTNFDVSYSTELREIPELPSSVQKVDARHCNSLTCETRTMLWSQFEHVYKGGFPVFKARGRLPVGAIAFVFGEVNAKAKGPLSVHSHGVGMHMLIEDERRQYPNFIVAENHVLLCGLRVLFSLELEELGNEWKTIRIYLETELTLCSWGVYVTNMEDIQFVSADSSSSLVWTISEEEKVRNKIQSLNLPEIFRGFQMQVRSNEERGYYKDKSPEYFECGQQLLQVLAKMSQRSMAPEEGEGTSGLNIGKEEDKEVDEILEWIAKTTIRGDEKSGGYVPENKISGIAEEDSSSECGSEG
ncbi:hypothetical protein VNO77_35925 [Canavalia gladiata]|uniref:Disease resistance protein RPS4B/Roq1-like leucine-rich repeats domain-containing protein n=1 Tax=Canavalia gladiata TaxID=3824 RepID=A0AAN9K9V4_CANGL